MSDQRLPPDDARALLSDHIEGDLDDATRKAVDDALAGDPVLAAEHRRLARTLRALRELPRPEPPSDMVARVRARLADERRGARDDTALAPVPPLVLPGHSALPAPRHSRGLDLFSALAAAAAVIAVVAVAVPGFRTGAGNGAVLGAGLSGQAEVTVTWRAPGMNGDDVTRLAVASGMAPSEGRFVGDRAAAARFLVALKGEAAPRGVDVAGVIPEQAERVVVVVVRD